MVVARFIIVFCFIAVIVILTLTLCAAIGGLAWMCLRDIIIDWKQYQLSDRVITIQEHDELMDSLQEVKDSMQVLGDTLRANGLLDSCEAITCLRSKLD